MKKSREEEDESSGDDDMIGPMPQYNEEENEIEEQSEDEFPISHEIVLKDHSKVSVLRIPLIAGSFSDIS